MGVRQVRSLKQSSSSSARTSFTLTSFAANIPVGDDIVIWVSNHTTSATAMSASDNSTQTGTANTYTVRLDSTTAGTNIRLVCITCHVTRQIQTTDTITVNHPSSTDAARAVQYTGSTGFDAASTTNTGSGTSVTTNTITTVATNGMLIAGVGSNNSTAGITAGTLAGGTVTVVSSVFLEGDTTNSGATSTKSEVADEYRPFIAGGTASATFTAANQSWASGVISLAAADPWDYCFNSNDSTLTTSNSQTFTFSINTIVGNRAIAVVDAWVAGTTAPTVNSISDSKNSTWNKDLDFTYADGTSFTGRISIWSVQIATQLLSSDNVTVAFASSPGVGGGRFAMLEYSGLSTVTAALDVSHNNTSGGTASSNPSSGTSGATAAAHELQLNIYGDNGYNRSWSTPPAGVVRIDHEIDTTNGDFSVFDLGSGAAGSTLSTSGTLNGTANWGMAVVAYQLPSSSTFPAGYGPYGHLGVSEMTQMIVQ